MSDHEARIVLILVFFLGMLLGAIFTLLFAPWIHRGGGR